MTSAPSFDGALQRRRLDRALAAGLGRLSARARGGGSRRSPRAGEARFRRRRRHRHARPARRRRLAIGRTCTRLAPTAASLGAGRFAGAVGDPERPPLGENAFDLAVSLLALHQVDDLPGALIQIRRALKPDGLFIAALPGGDTLSELRECLLLAESEMTGGASPRVAPFADARALGGLLQRAGFALPVVDSDRFTVRYADMFALMRDLRAFGATNALIDRSRRLPAASCSRAPPRPTPIASPIADGRVRATFEILWLSGWAPHPSQPKPLAPGSAKMRLEDAVKRKPGDALPLHMTAKSRRWRLYERPP